MYRSTPVAEYLSVILVVEIMSTSHQTGQDMKIPFEVVSSYNKEKHTAKVDDDP